MAVAASEQGASVQSTPERPLDHALTRALSLSLSRTTRAYLERWLPRIEEALLDGLAEADPHGVFGDALSYLFRAGGKRFRAVLALAACDLAGGDPGDALGPACAIEYLHASSLILDDLPCMDNDATRRGVPALHRRFGEETAVLVALVLFNRAHELLTAAPAPSAELRIRRHQHVCHALGGRGMMAGQMVDLHLRKHGRTDQAAALRPLHARKTSALIAAALLAGACTAPAPDAHIEALASYGELVGRAFQIADDALDVGEDPAAARLCALEDAARLRDEHVGAARGALQQAFPPSAQRDLLAEIAGAAVYRRA